MVLRLSVSQKQGVKLKRNPGLSCGCVKPHSEGYLSYKVCVWGRGRRGFAGRVGAGVECGTKCQETPRASGVTS